MEIIHQNKKAKLFKINQNYCFDYSIKNNLEINEIYYGINTEIFEDDYEDRIVSELNTMVAWDCFNGFGIFGDKKNIDTVKDYLLSYQKKHLTQYSDSDDLLEESGFHSFFTFKISNTNTYGIVALGYYMDMDPNMEKYLDTVKNLFVLKAGANYGFDGDPFDNFKVWIDGKSGYVKPNELEINTPNGMSVFDKANTNQNIAHINAIKNIF